MLAEVEKKVEGTLIATLKAEIGRLTEALQAEEKIASKKELHKQLVQDEIEELNKVFDGHNSVGIEGAEK